MSYRFDDNTVSVLNFLNLTTVLWLCERTPRSEVILPEIFRGKGALCLQHSLRRFGKKQSVCVPVCIIHTHIEKESIKAN